MTNLRWGFHIAFGVFLFSVTIYKLIVEKKLFFNSSFLSFYFGSVILWFAFLFLFLLTKKGKEKTFEVKKSGKYSIHISFFKEKDRESFFVSLEKLIRSGYFGEIPITWRVFDEKKEQNLKKRKKGNR